MGKPFIDAQSVRLSRSGLLILLHDASAAPYSVGARHRFGLRLLAGLWPWLARYHLAILAPLILRRRLGPHRVPAGRRRRRLRLLCRCGCGAISTRRARLSALRLMV